MRLITEWQAMVRETEKLEPILESGMGFYLPLVGKKTAMQTPNHLSSTPNAVKNPGGRRQNLFLKNPIISTD